MQVVGTTWSLDKDTFYVSTLLDAGILSFTEDVAEICEAAEKQAGIETKLSEVKRKWASTDFSFTRTTRDVPMLSGHATVMEDLEESQLILQTLLSMRHVAPFREAVTATLAHLSDAVDTLEIWIKVQLVRSVQQAAVSGRILLCERTGLTLASWLCDDCEPVTSCGPPSSRCFRAATLPNSCQWSPRSSCG